MILSRGKLYLMEISRQVAGLLTVKIDSDGYVNSPYKRNR